MKVFQKVVNRCADVICVLLVIILMCISPMIIGYQPMIVLSGSMEPTYHVGSLIYVKQTPFDKLEVGDVITYGKSRSQLVSHRIVEISQLSQTVVTKGDANQVSDKEIQSHLIRGKIGAISIPYMGYIFQIVRKPIVLGMCLALFVVKIYLDENNGRIRI